MNSESIKPHSGEVEEAAANANGWVYRIEGEYRSEEAVPPEAIVGAWKVGPDGKIVGAFVPNPNYVPKR